jgi:hypothetical protein
VAIRYTEETGPPLSNIVRYPEAAPVDLVVLANQAVPTDEEAHNDYVSHLIPPGVYHQIGDVGSLPGGAYAVDHVCDVGGPGLSLHSVLSALSRLQLHADGLTSPEISAARRASGLSRS